VLGSLFSKKKKTDAVMPHYGVRKWVWRVECKPNIS